MCLSRIACIHSRRKATVVTPPHCFHSLALSFPFCCSSRLGVFIHRFSKNFTFTALLVSSRLAFGSFSEVTCSKQSAFFNMYCGRSSYCWSLFHNMAALCKLCHIFLKEVYHIRLVSKATNMDVCYNSLPDASFH